MNKEELVKALSLIGWQVNAINMIIDHTGAELQLYANSAGINSQQMNGNWMLFIEYAYHKLQYGSNADNQLNSVGLVPLDHKDGEPWTLMFYNL